MISSFWSVKGGNGTSVAAAIAATGAAALGPTTMVDLAGDQNLLLDAAAGDREGVAEWSHTSRQTGAYTPARESVGNRGLHLWRRGAGAMDASRAPDLSERMKGLGTAVVDAGMFKEPGYDRYGDESFRRAVVEASDESLLVIKSCSISVNRAVDCGLRPTGVVLVDDNRRTLDANALERWLEAPVVATVPVDSDIALAADAGLMELKAWREPYQHLAEVVDHYGVDPFPNGRGQAQGTGTDPKQWCPWWDRAERAQFINDIGWAISLRVGHNSVDDNDGEVYIYTNGVTADLEPAAKACKDLPADEWRWFLHSDLEEFMHEGSPRTGQEHANPLDARDPGEQVDDSAFDAGYEAGVDL